MDRRRFLSCLALATPAMGAAQRIAAVRSPQAARVEKCTAGSTPRLVLNHLGFLPRGKKVLIVRAAASSDMSGCSLRDIGHLPKPTPLRLDKVTSDLGDCLVANFDLEKEGLYQVTMGDESSVPFFVRPDVWRRTLPKAIEYFKYQRCGMAVPNFHPACHLDDARRRDTGEYLDVTGGWHDAGDLRKPMYSTMMIGIGLLQLARNLGENWDQAGSGLARLHDEVRWGNRYFLRMQDSDGLIWRDTACDEAGQIDNHWTDNRVGTSDERYINVQKPAQTSAIFVVLQAMVASAFRKSDPPYAERCLAAAVRCWNASKRTGDLYDLSWWALAGLEMHRATRRVEYADAARSLATELLSLQNRSFIGSQRIIRGFWYISRADSTPAAHWGFAALPSLVLLELSEVFSDHPDAGRWRDAVRLHLDEYVVPMTSRSAYRIVPFGVFTGSPTPEHYRPLAGELTYRYFMPVRKEFWWVGLNSHLQGYALALGIAARAFNRNGYRDLAYRQLEWIMGANPFGACLMTGEGLRNPYPYSRFVGQVPGGIINGIGGNTQDEPVLDTECVLDWRTGEYWSPHNAFYIWAVSLLEAPARSEAGIAPLSGSHTNQT